MSLDISIVQNCSCCHACETVFESNITHNLIPVWNKAGVYEALYMSDGKEPIDIVCDLEKGCVDMVKNRKEYEKLNPKNGWGDCEAAISFLEKLVFACHEYAINHRIEISK